MTEYDFYLQRQEARIEQGLPPIEDPKMEAIEEAADRQMDREKEEGRGEE